MQKSRREFLKNATKTSVAVAGVGVVLAGCSKNTPNENVVQGKSPKEEILYQKSKQWDLYYSVAK
ncbi:twin-arginine translocation signal domain-containing protein [Helicobacter apodemus]|uniref:Twin-arginine translocation signal domain-containing protein n=1 Tax=Helicobacter apodemus TaxID=135569 RepID=A0A2U8FFW1_9HELI|nr:twin-arginine translocation signal domain-containing protein [Helicobacter apodemus]AWI35053.1 hypothetical protein CDV25_02080 [Helicobacter apodemus]